ncbi:CRPV-054 [Crowpox virus]|nr:CRPV-054 [Crowpox virus]
MINIIKEVKWRRKKGREITVKSIGIKMYDLCNSNKYAVCNCISKSQKFCYKSFSGNGNTSIVIYY